MVANLYTDKTTREEVVSNLLGTRNVLDPSPTFWDYDSYNHIRENAERLRYHQMLLEKDLAAEGTLNRQLTEQLAEQITGLGSGQPGFARCTTQAAVGTGRRTQTSGAGIA